MKETLRNLIEKARGDQKAQTVFKNCQLINVFTGEILQANLAIEGGKIAGIGSYEGVQEVDLGGKFILPAFIDSHVHIESSLSSPGQFARAIIPRGVTSIITDPHEIANVKGLDGIRYMIEDSQKSPLDVYFALPSCVPATDFESSGAILEAKDLEELIQDPSVIGLGEMMDFPGLIQGKEEILDKLLLAQGKMIDGHAPQLAGKDLVAYAAAGVQTDHEASSLAEALDRVRLGLYLLVREGSAARDLKNLLPAINKDNLSRFLFCTDDKHPEDLLKEGSIDHNVRLAIQEGLDPIDAIKIASLNPALCYGLKGKGALAPGYDADFIITDDLEKLPILEVYKSGKLLAQDGQALFDSVTTDSEAMKKSVHIGKVAEEDLALKIEGKKIRLIEVLPHSLITGESILEKEEVFDSKGRLREGINKIVVLERHKASGNMGLGLIKNISIKGGAIGTTIAHDSHNLILAGDNDTDLHLLIQELEKIGGGIAVASQGKILKSLSLPIAGLMTEAPIEETEKILKEMQELAYEVLGVNPEIDPFMTLSFMSLPVIPKLKITDQGLFDLEKLAFVDLSFD